MKDLFNYLGQTKIYVLSVGISSVLTTILNFITTYTPTEFLGISISMIAMLLVLNLFDIQSGIKANIVKRKKEGKTFAFESGKGWRAIEKVFIFIVAIWFFHAFEKECLKNDFSNYITNIFIFGKFIVALYVGVVEFQSIGENREVIYGKKERVFHLLDKLLIAIDEGIIKKTKSLFKSYENE